MAYTTASRVREEFAFLISEENQTGKTGTTLTLKERAYAIERISRDGVALSEPADFTFLPSREISLVTTAVADDQFNIVYHVMLSTEAITALITKAETIINARMVRVFGEDVVPWTAAPVLIQEITTELVGCLAARSMTYKNHSGFSAEHFIDMWMKWKKVVDEKLAMIEEGRMEVIGETPTGDTEVTVGQTGDLLFVPLEDYEDVDYFTHLDHETRRTRGETGKIDP